MRKFIVSVLFVCIAGPTFAQANCRATESQVRGLWDATIAKTKIYEERLELTKILVKTLEDLCATMNRVPPPLPQDLQALVGRH